MKIISNTDQKRADHSLNNQSPPRSSQNSLQKDPQISENRDPQKTIIDPSSINPPEGKGLLKVDHSFKVKIRNRPVVENLSAAEVKNKWKKHFQHKIAAEKQLELDSTKNSEGTMINTDNDPRSSLTQEKLKGVLKSGGVNFNESERKTLEAILSS